ncbi:MAG: hypothetical protein ABIC95_00505 [archaeon]
MRRNPAASGMMLVSIIGFFISVFTIYNWWPEWGFTFALFFLILFVASLIRLSKAEADLMLRREAALAHEARRKPRISRALRIRPARATQKAPLKVKKAPAERKKKKAVKAKVTKKKTAKKKTARPKATKKKTKKRT